MKTQGIYIGMIVKRLTTVLGLTLALVAAPMVALAQAYPSQPIHIVVPYPAGGSGDTVARILAQEMRESMKQAVLVENRPGGNSIIGAESVAKASPDGYTLLLTFDPPYSTLPHILRKVPFDPVKSFTPITLVARTPQALVVNASVPVTSLKEFIEYAKARPGKVFCATTGVGTSQHFGIELLNQMEGTKIIPVSYKGGPPALVDLLGGQVQASINPLVSINSYMKSGKLRVLAVMESSRARMAPDLPTMAEAGVQGYDMPDLWIGLFGPADMPRSLVSRIHSEVVKAVDAPGVRAQLEKLGFELVLGSSSQMAEIITRNVGIYGKIAAKAGIQPE